MSDSEITLVEAIAHLRQQLTEAESQGEHSAIRFVPSSVEVELGLKFTREKSGTAGVKLFSFLDLSAGGKTGGESAHRIKLTLQPVGPDGRPKLLSDSE